MNRVHLFEIEDQKWFPTFLRNYMTDFLQFLSNKTKIYQPIVNLLSEKIIKSGHQNIIDLASGGGGGLLWLSGALKKNISGLHITLTDYYPNIAAFQQTQQESDIFSYETASVDARNVPAHLKGFRTQFLSFHHFKPADAVQILQNAVDSKSPIAVFEAQDRSILSIVAMIFSPLSVLLTTPFIRPFQWGRLFFTYIIPLIPVFVLWDGLVSSFRTYSVREMNDLIRQVAAHDDFEWSAGKEKNILYLIGLPKP